MRLWCPERREQGPKWTTETTLSLSLSFDMHQQPQQPEVRISLSLAYGPTVVLFVSTVLWCSGCSAMNCPSKSCTLMSLQNVKFTQHSTASEQAGCPGGNGLYTFTGFQVTTWRFCGAWLQVAAANFSSEFLKQKPRWHGKRTPKRKIYEHFIKSLVW